jgi:hypothetical protein
MKNIEIQIDFYRYLRINLCNPGNTVRRLYATLKQIPC